MERKFFLNIYLPDPRGRMKFYDHQSFSSLKARDEFMVKFVKFHQNVNFELFQSF